MPIPGTGQYLLVFRNECDLSSSSRDKPPVSGLSRNFLL